MNRPVFILSPHPDDETLGCGGQLVRFAREGIPVYISVLTDGSQLFASRFGTETRPSPEEVSSLRKKETERAVDLLGGDSGKIRYLDYSDGKLADRFEDAVEHVVQRIRDLNPSRVYVTSPFEVHPDHCTANAIAKEALRQLGTPVPELWEYCVGPTPEFGSVEGDAELVEQDITDVLDLKKAAVGLFDCHLKITLEGQQQPLWTDGSEYLNPVERFLVTPGNSDHANQ